MSPIKNHKPFVLPKTNTSVSRKKALEAEIRGTERAQNRKKVLLRARRLVNEEGKSITEAHKILLEFAANPEHSFDGEVPSISQFCEWFKKWGRSGPIPEVSAFKDRPRSGAPRREISDEIWEFVERQILALKCPGPTELMRVVNEKFGKVTISRWIAERCYLELGEAPINAAWYGPKVSIADATPKGTTPTERTNERWIIDEFQLNVWVRVYDYVNDRWVAKKPWCCAVLDEHSRALLAVDVFEPNERGETRSYSTLNVISVLFSACVPELALPAVRDMVGEIAPIIRMDNLKSHSGVKKFINKLGIETPKSRFHTPHGNGRIERLIGVVKPVFREVWGNAAHFQPVWRNRAGQRAQRTRAAGAGRRVLRKVDVQVDDLYTVKELRQELSGLVDAYLTRGHSSLKDQHPRYVFFRDREPKNAVLWGDDLISLLSPHRIKLGRKLECAGENFAPFVDGSPLEKGQSYTLRLEPSKRCAWLVTADGFVFLPGEQDYAREIDYVGQVVEEAAAARNDSDYAEMLLERHVVETRGQDVLDNGKAAARIYLKKPSRLDRSGSAKPQQDHDKKKKGPTPQPDPTAIDAAVPHPWKPEEPAENAPVFIRQLSMFDDDPSFDPEGRALVEAGTWTTGDWEEPEPQEDGPVYWNGSGQLAMDFGIYPRKPEAKTIGRPPAAPTAIKSESENAYSFPSTEPLFGEGDLDLSWEELPS